MATIYGVFSNYVAPDYVADDYVEGKSVTSTCTVTATAVDRDYPDNIIYSWTEAGSDTYTWDNWWLTDQTWDQKGIIFRAKSTVDVDAVKVFNGTADLTFDFTTNIVPTRKQQGTSIVDGVLSSTIDSGVLYDAAGIITGTSSVVALGGYERAANASIQITSVVTNNSTNALTLGGIISLDLTATVSASGIVDYSGFVQVPCTLSLQADTAVQYVGASTIDLGSVIVTVASATPVPDPYREWTVDSETRQFPLKGETRSTIIASETRTMIIPQETRTITVADETRVYKVPIPPIVTPNIRRNT